MRKVTVVIICLIMVLASFACSNTQGTNTYTQNAQVETASPTEAPTPTPTVEPTLEPTAAPTATPTPKPTNIPKKELLGAWKSCGLTTEDGKYYTVKQLEDIGNYNITDFYTILNEKDAEVYIQGDIYQNVSWRTTVNGVVVGTNEMTLEKGKLSWKFENEVLWYERVSGVKTVNDIKKNPYVKATLGQKNALKKAASYLSFLFT